MLVYGDPQYKTSLRGFLAHLRALLNHTEPNDLEGLRTLLIQTGQLEQGVQDLLSSPSAPARPISPVQTLTDYAAEAFYSVWAAMGNAPTAELRPPGESLTLLRRAMEELAVVEDETLTIKIAEGFEFYALFPEQYCVSALNWARRHAGTWPKQAMVVGIRSIGTSLSAAVCAALHGAGWQTQRVTVRPTGHPFSRQATLKLPDDCAAHCALVVDEGPGISGSSMAAAAQALAAAGFGDIAFFPGHAGSPGPAASAEVRQWWAETPRYCTRTEDLRWSGMSLSESLAAMTPDLENPPGGIPSPSKQDIAVEDLGGGLWRRKVFPEIDHWPAVAPTLERMKYFCSRPGQRPILWKFAGLGCCIEGGQTASELISGRMAARAFENATPTPLRTFRGFIAMPWIEGRRLAPADAADAATVAQIGRYLARAAGAPLPDAEAAMSHSRLAEMAYWNTREALGEAWAQRARAKTPNACPSTLSYGDGRTAPHEWVRTRTGALIKTDTTGHDLDHTLIGRQSALWDLAGVLVEWDLAPVAAGPLLRAFAEAGIDAPAEALAFYEMAYAAFRLGVVSLCAGDDAGEQRRCQRAAAFYRDALARRIE